jgi:hypothetical protein
MCATGSSLYKVLLSADEYLAYDLFLFSAIDGVVPGLVQ